MLRTPLFTLFLLAASGLALMVAGCSRTHTSAEQTPVPAESTMPAANLTDGEQDHEHRSGAHGGSIASLGQDSYHVEAVFEQGGLLRLYMLGQDESRVHEVESQELVAFAKADGDLEAESFTIGPEPQPGDTEGKTSLFVGQLPAELAGRDVTVTIPNIRIAGERFRFAVQSASPGDDSHTMPEKVADAAGSQLYLTPGGLYTAADIAANGRQTAAQKFKGFKAAHDLKPKVGDPICPVTLTKANPKVAWTIGGQEYTFCCPPCVDEFVTWAKESPDQIKQPEDYIKREP